MLTTPLRAPSALGSRLRAFGAAALLTPLVALSACQDHPLAVLPAPEAIGPRALGVVEVTLSGIGTPTQQASARPIGGSFGASYSLSGVANGDQSGNGTIQLDPVSTGSFTSGVRGAGGVRYLYATFRVRNAATNGNAYDTERRNLTFVAVATGSTLNLTPIASLRRFDGSPASAGVAAQLVPTGAVMQRADGSVGARFADVLQLYSEADLATLPSLPGVTYFPYGFVVSNPSTSGSCMLPASPAAGQWDGLVTFAFRVPLQSTAAEDPFTLTLMFKGVDDAVTRITQSAEEQDAAGEAAFAARALALGATQLNLLPGSNYGGGPAVRRLCSVRTAGSSGSATAELGGCPAIAAVVVSPDSVSAAVGDTVQLSATVTDVNCEEASWASVSWSSSDPLVATVDQNGLVTITGEGNASITATAGGVDGTASVTGTSELVFTTIAAGSDHTCGLTAAGKAYCWGHNVFGQLGDGTSTQRWVPTPVTGEHTFTRIAAGGIHTVALTSTGAAYAWGANWIGQLGDGSTTARYVPTAVKVD